MKYAVLGCEIATEKGKSPASMRVLPAGRFRAADGSGRPVEVPEGWLLTEDAGRRIIAELAGKSNALLVDYEHQSLNTGKNGQPVPAAAWCKEFIWQEDGLYAINIDWTEKAAAMIANREYRYLSPVFTYNSKTGEVAALISMGLTNTPGLDGLTDLAALNAQQETGMDKLLEELRWMLNLPTASTGDEILAELDKLKTQLQGAKAENLTAFFDAASARDKELAELKAASVADKTGSVPMAEHAKLQKQVAALTAQIAQDKHQALLEAGLADGRIFPAQKEYWEKQPLNALEAWLDVAQPIAALSGTQTGGQPPVQTAALGAEEAYVAQALGLSAEEYTKYKETK